MKQFILILLFWVSMALHSFAQFSAGLEMGMPTSNSSDIGSQAIGASLRYDIPFQNRLAFTGAVGYLRFSGHGIIPISYGIKYYFSEASKGLYAAADLGLNFIPGDLRFGYSPGVGYRTNRWDLTGRGNAISNANYFSVRVAYIFHPK